MIINFKSRLIETLEKYSLLTNPSTGDSLTGNSVGLIIGIILISLFLIAFICFIAYLCPCWNCYNLCLYCLVSQPCCNCVNLYDQCCPHMDQKALLEVERGRTNNQIYVQDMLTTPDGRIIQYSDPRPVFKSRRFSDTEII